MAKKLKASDNKAKDTEKKIPPIPRQPSNLDAMNLIDGCVSQAPLSRTLHVQAQKALQQISAALGELDRLKNSN